MDMQFGSFRLKSQERQVLGVKGPLDLSGRSFDILAILLAHPDTVVSKSDLFEAAWPGLVVEENTLQVHVSALRKALPNGMIVTVHGRGYKYAGPAPVPTEGDGTVAPPGVSRPSIAVLPFKNLSGDAEQDYFSDGITEDIIAELGNFREFLVIGRNSAFQFRNATADAAKVAHRLGVQYLVEGSVRKVGNRIRVSVELVDVTSATHVWAERYDRDLDDIFAIQDEITQMISARLARQARLAVTSRSRSRPTDSMSAYDLYLRALQKTGTYETMLQAEPFLLRALELDPDFAAAHALLGLVHCVKYFWDDDRGHLPLGLALAEKAQRLDSEEPYGHLAAGCALLFLRRFREAETSLDRAVALNSNDPLVRTIRALVLTYTSRPESALDELEEARRRDPFAMGWFNDFRGIALVTAGRYHDAIALYETMPEVTPWFKVHLMVCLWHLGQIDRACEVLRQFMAFRPQLTLDEALATEDLFEDRNIHDRNCAIIHKIAEQASMS
jgi:TolB-like protein